jgi:hypothetical protein
MRYCTSCTLDSFCDGTPRTADMDCESIVMVLRAPSIGSGVPAMSSRTYSAFASRATFAASRASRSAAACARAAAWNLLLDASRPRTARETTSVVAPAIMATITDAAMSSTSVNAERRGLAAFAR